MPSGAGSGGAAEDPARASEASEIGGDLLLGPMSRAGEADIAGRYQLTATKRSSPPNSGTHEAPNGLQPRTPCRFPRVRQIAM